MMQYAPIADNGLSYDEAESILQRLAGDTSGDHPEFSTFSAVLACSAKGQPQRQTTVKRVRPKPAPNLWTEKTFRNLLESAPDALVLFDGDGTIALVNTKAEQLFGYQRSEVLGLSVEIFVPELLQHPHLPLFGSSSASSFASPSSNILELYGRRKEGRDFPIEISFSPLQTGEGTLVSSTIRDITNSRRLEARYRNLVEGIPAVTFLAALDEGENELYVSPQIEQLLGFSQKEWLEDPVLWYTRLHPDDRDRWHLEFAKTCALATPFKSVYRFIARDGRIVWVQGEAKVVRDATGRPLFLQGIAFDITERKSAEEALRKAHDELDELVQQRTSELAGANRELQRALSEKESLLKEIHHRVKNNLQIVSSLLNLQSATIKDSQTLQAIRESQNRVKSMALIHEKLYKSRDLARIEMGNYLRELIGYLFRSYGIESSGVTLQVEMHNVSLTLDAAIPCGLIVTELVSNCFKHAFPEPRQGAIVVSLKPDKSDSWLLIVKDNGVGLPAGFDPVNSESLGLQLVNALVNQLGGSMNVAVACGTSFEIQFTEPATK